MKHTVFLFLTLVLPLSAHSTDFSGVKLNGEASFDYTFLSTKQNTIPAMGAATNEAYRLNQVQIVANKETDEISFTGRLLFSPTVYVSQASPEVKSVSNFGPLDQMEIYYKFTPQLSLGFGRLYTTMGYESFLRSENPTYGNSIASQTIVPLNGEGLRAKYSSGEWLTATISSYNQTAYYSSLNTVTPTKSTELSATGILGNFSWFASYYWGIDPAVGTSSKVDKNASSVWTAYKLTDNFTAAITYDSKMFTPENSHNHWADSTGVVITYGLGINNFAVRYEMVRGAMELTDLVTGSAYGNTVDKINSLTLTDKIAVNDNFKLFAEYRLDQADEAVFIDENGVAKKDVSIVTIGAVTHF